MVKGSRAKGNVQNFKKFSFGRSQTLFKKANELAQGHHFRQEPARVGVIYETNDIRLLYVSEADHGWPFDINAMRENGFELVANGDAGPSKLDELYGSQTPALRSRVLKNSPDLTLGLGEEEVLAPTQSAQRSSSMRRQFKATPPSRRPAGSLMDNSINPFAETGEVSPVPSFGSEGGSVDVDDELMVQGTPSLGKGLAATSPHRGLAGQKRHNSMLSANEGSPCAKRSAAINADAPTSRLKQQRRDTTPLPALEDAEFDWSYE